MTQQQRASSQRNGISPMTVENPNMTTTTTTTTLPTTAIQPSSPRPSTTTTTTTTTTAYQYGQVVIGPCGSGKTTYCHGMQQYLQLLHRNVGVINLDPANYISKQQQQHIPSTDKSETLMNDTVPTTTPPPPSLINPQNSTTNNNIINNTALPYIALYDICIEAINLQSVMNTLHLGPNGGLLYCMEYIELHIYEIISTIQSRCINNTATTSNHHDMYYIIDLPGQIELYTHNTCVQNIIRALSSTLHIQFTGVQLIDALYCTDVTKFISVAILGTTTMLRLELPMVNVLSKIDLLSSYGELPFQLDYFTDCHELDRLIPFLYQGNHHNDNDDSQIYDIMDDPDYQRMIHKRHNTKFMKRYEKLHRSLAEVVDDYNLLSFLPLDITNVESVGRVLSKIDKCNGYIYTHQQPQQQQYPNNDASSTTTTRRNINEDLFQCAIRSDSIQDTYEAISDIRERIASPESIKDLQ